MSAHLPKLRCVLQECDECGLEKVLQCESKETANADHLAFQTRQYVSVTRSVPGYDDKTQTEPRNVNVTLQSLFDQIREKFPFMMMHDYLAHRLAHMFQAHNPYIIH